jgi:pyruvate formate lyase activating enzyme
MKMEIKGFVPTSLVDWEGKVTSVIFVGGCNFKCGYCSNKDLVLHPEELKSIDLKGILEYLVRNKDFIDGVVISGGEPTLYPEVITLCKEIKNIGFKIKLDTNGSNPERLKEFLDNGLVEYLAMDIKTSFEKYKELINFDWDIEKIKKSIFLVSQFPEYEFRITLSPVVKKEDLLSIVKYLKENRINKSFFLHQFKPDSCINGEFEKMTPYKDSQILEFHELIKDFFEKCGVRNI